MDLLRRGRSVLSASLMLVVCACHAPSALADNRAVAESAVGTFRRLYKDGKYAELYNMGSPHMKGLVTEGDFIAAVRTTATQYGAFKGGTQAAAACFPKQVRFVYLSQFEKARVTEIMIWEINSGKAELYTYRIAPGLAEVPNVEKTKCPSVLR